MLYASLANDLRDRILEIIDTIGYAGVAFLVALENLFPPIPSEVVLPAAGFYASTGDATLIGMILAATLGSVIGAWALYAIAALIGPDRLDRFLLRFGRWVGVKPADVARANGWFDDHANKAVMICRCVPLIRSLVSIPAGFRRMDPIAFTIYTAIGSLVWNILLVGAGYQLGDNWEQVEGWISKFQYLVIAVIAAVGVWWVWTRLLSPTRRAHREGHPPVET